MPNSFVVLSGGVDSTVLVYHLVNTVQDDVAALYVNHGQPAAPQELSSARSTARRLRIPLKIIDARGIWAAFAEVAGPHIHMMTSGCTDPTPTIPLAAHYAGWSGAKNMYRYHQRRRRWSSMASQARARGTGRAAYTVIRSMKVIVKGGSPLC